MSTYLVRLSADSRYPHEIVGIYVAADMVDLWSLVDQCTSPTKCECAMLKPGHGFMWFGRGPTSDRLDDEAPYTVSPTYGLVGKVRSLGWKKMLSFEDYTKAMAGR